MGIVIIIDDDTTFTLEHSSKPIRIGSLIGMLDNDEQVTITKDGLDKILNALKSIPAKKPYRIDVSAKPGVVCRFSILSDIYYELIECIPAFEKSPLPHYHMNMGFDDSFRKALLEMRPIIDTYFAISG